MEQRNRKILITAKESVLTSLEADLFKVFDGCKWEVYKYLLKFRYSKLYNKLFFEKNTLRDFLDGLQTTNAAGRVISVFMGPVDCGFVEKDPFKNWLLKDKNTDDFLNNLFGMDTPFLVKKRENAELYVAPVLNDNYNDNNVCYVEELINVIKGSEEDDLYLLLHDKDLYKNVDGGIKHRKVTVNDANLSDKVNSMQKLKEMINKERVFVFTHQPTDNYYKRIVSELNNIAVGNIVDILYTISHNVDFASSIGNEMTITRMRECIAGEKEFYDFSKKFF